MHVTASQIRQDLNNFGGFGQQGYGYNVKYLYTEIGKILGLDRSHNFIIIGAGNLGQALANYASFERSGFILKSLFDVNPRLEGVTIRGIPVRMVDELEDFLKNNDIEIAALTLPKSKAIEVKNATENNLKNISVKFPLGVFTCVTGVSGSGKSTLVNEVLYKTIAKELNGSSEKPGKCKEVKGLENIDKIINIDQSPIGRTPRSNPATYTGVFDLIRDIFAGTNEAKLRGFEKGRFSFNVAGGRCESCNGDGVHKIEMHFLPDVYVPCEVCKGKRYNRETLEVKYKGKNIADVLNMTVEEALEFFDKIPKIKQKIQTLYDVGLGYIKLGQPSTTLSGGEAQRVKLATELSKRATGKTLYILDEPTTGLDPQTRQVIWNVIEKLRIEEQMTVFLTTHYMEEAANAAYVVILDKGSIVAEGTPYELKNRYVQDTISVYGVTEAQIKSLHYNYKKVHDGYQIKVDNTSEATKLIVEHQELFQDYEVVKGGMDDVFLAVTGKTLGGGRE